MSKLNMTGQCYDLYSIDTFCPFELPQYPLSNIFPCCDLSGFLKLTRLSKEQYMIST